MTDFHKNDSWILKRLKQAWPVLLLLAFGVSWTISQYYDIGGRVGASEEDIQDIKQAQMEEIKAREELLTEIQEIKQDVAAIEAGNKIHLGLLQQILGILRQ